MLDDVVDVVSYFHLIVYTVDNSILDMSIYDDDAPSQSDRCECPMMSPQPRRALRLSEGRTCTNGLNDRMSVPEKRTTSLRSGKSRAQGVGLLSSETVEAFCC